MRLKFVLLLVFSMICGTASATYVGRVWFPLNPTPAKEKENVARSKVLVAKDDIPSGTTVYADRLEFQFVAIESIPVGTLTEYSSVSGRITRYPIAKGSPICDWDLDGFVEDVAASEGCDAPGKTDVATSPVSFSSFSDSENELKNKTGGISGIPEGLYAFPVRIDRIAAAGAASSRDRVVAEVSGESLDAVVSAGDKVDLFLLETARKIDVREAGIAGDSVQNGRKYVFSRAAPEKLIAELEVYASPETLRPTFLLLMTKDQIALAKHAAQRGRLQVRPRDRDISIVASEEEIRKTERKNASETLYANEHRVPFPVDVEHDDFRVALPGPPLGEQVKRPNTAELSHDEPIPEVIHIGIRSTKKHASKISSDSKAGETVSQHAGRSPILRISPANRTAHASRFALRASDRENEGDQRAVEVYSFDPRSKRKADLFPKYRYESRTAAAR